MRASGDCGGCADFGWSSLSLEYEYIEIVVSTRPFCKYDAAYELTICTIPDITTDGIAVTVKQSHVKRHYYA